MCEVVGVIGVHEHLGSRALDLVWVQTYDDKCIEVVHERGVFRIGDFATYISAGCFVPTTRPEFQWLRARLDHGFSRIKYKLKRVSIRGKSSPGILIPAPPYTTIGQTMDEALGVTWVLSEMEKPFPSYHLRAE